MITREKAIEILKLDFNPDNYQYYREAHFIFYGNWNAGCSCNKSGLYRKLKQYLKDNKLI